MKPVKSLKRRDVEKWPRTSAHYKCSQSYDRKLFIHSVLSTDVPGAMVYAGIQQ